MTLVAEKGRFERMPVFLVGHSARSAVLMAKVALSAGLLLLGLGACRGSPASGAAQPIASAPTSTEAATVVWKPSVTASATPSRTASPSPTSSSTATPTSTPSPTPSLLHTTENLLVLGVDHRTGDEDPSWRTDTIMVLAIDRSKGQVGIVSIPRDLYVDIPGLGKNRINQADFYGHRTEYPGGGAALLGRVITETLGIPTEHYVRIQMDGLVRLVDAMGGVTVTLDCPLYERTPDETSPNGLVDWNLPAGEVLLDGNNAKKFATFRYVTSDFGRAQRQQQLIWAMRDRALQLDMVPRVPELWSAFQDTFSTDLDIVSVVRLVALAAKLKPGDVHGMVFGSDVLEPFVTDEGGMVLQLKDRGTLDEELGLLFESRPLAALGHSGGGGGCPAEPTPVPTFTPTPTVEASPQATG